MKGTGPAHLFVYYQMPYTINENGEVEDLKGAHKPIFVLSDGKFNSNMGANRNAPFQTFANRYF